MCTLLDVTLNTESSGHKIYWAKHFNAFTLFLCTRQMKLGQATHSSWTIRRKRTSNTRYIQISNKKNVTKMRYDIVYKLQKKI